MDEVIDQIKEWKEKAEKWDESQVIISSHIPSGKTTIDTDLWMETQEKAKKWDDYEHTHSPYIPMHQKEYYIIKEKAKKYDEIKEILSDS